MGVNNEHNIDRGCITIGRQAPDFTTLSTEGIITLSQYRGKWVLLFSEPAVFAAISTSSIIELAKLQDEFEKKNVQILMLTLDNNFANIEWLNNIYDNFGIIVRFPILEDRDKKIANNYNIVSPDRIYENSVRDLFIISPTGLIRAIITYPISLGRNYYEVLRAIDSLQLTEMYNVFTPANWMPGEPVMIPTVQKFSEAILLKENDKKLGLDCLTWYNCFKDYYSLGDPVQISSNCKNSDSF